MKVITQLIQHFWQRRDLSVEQAAYLVDQGFVRAGDLDGFAMPPEVEIPVATAPAVPPPDEFEELEAELVEETAAARRGRGKPKGEVLSEKDLVSRVDAVLAERADALAAVRAWAGHYGRVPDWTVAVAAVRKAPAAAFEAGLVDGLRKTWITLADLWAAFDAEPLHAVIDDPAPHGPVVRAYRLLLDAGQPVPLRHGFLLKHPTLQAARGLAHAHRRLLAGLVGLFDRHPKLLAAALGRAAPPVPFWALVLVYNARRVPLYGIVRPALEYGPLAMPAAGVWRPAWSAALRMDPPAVTRLLVACYADAGERDDRDPLRCTFQIVCPRTWRVPAAV